MGTAPMSALGNADLAPSPKMGEGWGEGKRAFIKFRILRNYDLAPGEISRFFSASSIYRRIAFSNTVLHKNTREGYMIQWIAPDQQRITNYYRVLR